MLFHPLHSHILEVVSLKTCSVGVSVVILVPGYGDMGWPQVAESHLVVSPH